MQVIITRIIREKQINDDAEKVEEVLGMVVQSAVIQHVLLVNPRQQA